ncbi:MAG: hypothetical protein KME60_02230 [Cyanomargarita calcarea GSE-NOS-MK-12-04C]|jgi:predicted nucleic acid-binding protein|uniref:PIN domain-containing protein n=1 Tax=Cyanomargarita calcarea GSE-NOS-MK-12-04C TaxID=2839659 RepID=A0A951QH08_9CYAN|nr:hypothetical protein [Cyanomargarita calcarea GSE-NOS-MK-12-04C]
MTYLVDTNVLLRLAQNTDPLHPPARSAYVALEAEDKTLKIVPQTIIEFWVVATRPVSVNGFGFSIAQVSYEIGLMKQLFILQPDTSAIFTEWEKLVVKYHFCPLFKEST